MMASGRSEKGIGGKKSAEAGRVGRANSRELVVVNHLGGEKIKGTGVRRGREEGGRNKGGTKALGGGLFRRFLFTSWPVWERGNGWGESPL